ncbi:MAG: IPT/TIG domain-containing protein, partial [Bacteroidetes bacterium]|nr:IPT/TIG domain-containing protein [Bacteroidota bacterium]
MKQFYLLLMLFFIVSNGRAQLYEGFNYAAGENIGGTCNPNPCSGNNWTTHAASNAGTIDVLSGSLSYPGLQASSGNRIYIPGANATTTRDVNMPAAITGTPQIAYYSFLLKVIDNTQLITTGPSVNAYFVSFGKTAGNSISNAIGRVGIRSVNAGANFRLNIVNGNGGGSFSLSEITADLDFGATYLVVVKYEITAANKDIATLWVNPSSLGEAEPGGGVTNNSLSGGAVVSVFGSVAISNAPNTPKAEIDEIRTGTTWASVTPAPPVVNSFTPTGGYSGTPIVITGNHFTDATGVTIGGTNAASFTVDNSTQITAVVGAGASGPVNVATAIGDNSSAATFTYNGYITNAGGNWNAGTTWLGGNVPPSNADVTVSNAISADISPAVANLTLSGSLLTLGNNNITVSGVVNGASSSAYIITNGTGRMIHSNVGTTPVLFPVGTASSYTPATIANGSNHSFSCNVQPTFTNPLPGNEAVLRQWNIADETGGPVSAALTLQWNAADEHASFNRNLCAMA